jgi:ribonuclease HII
MEGSPPALDWESRLWQQGLTRIAGVDEVGRGSLAGRVVAAAVVLPQSLDPKILEGLRDSKQLSRLQRERLLPLIRSVAVAIGLGSATVREIDQLNIRQATILAMQRALAQLPLVEHILLDGLPLAELPGSQTALVKGDQISLSIAAASVVAKVQRDRWMGHLHHFYPQYGWDRNVGYGTHAHRQAIQQQGSSRHHRQTFLSRILSPEQLSLPESGSR